MIYVLISIAVMSAAFAIPATIVGIKAIKYLNEQQKLAGLKKKHLSKSLSEAFDESRNCISPPKDGTKKNELEHPVKNPENWDGSPVTLIKSNQA